MEGRPRQDPEGARGGGASGWTREPRGLRAESRGPAGGASGATMLCFAEAV